MSDRPSSVPLVRRPKAGSTQAALPAAKQPRPPVQSPPPEDEPLDPFDVVAFGMEWLSVMVVMVIVVTSFANFVLAPLVRLFLEH